MIQKLKRIVSDALWHDCKQCIRGFLRGHVDLLESPVFINVGNPVDKNIELKILRFGKSVTGAVFSDHSFCIGIGFLGNEIFERICKLDISGKRI